MNFVQFLQFHHLKRSRWGKWNGTDQITKPDSQLKVIKLIWNCNNLCLFKWIHTIQYKTRYLISSAWWMNEWLRWFGCAEAGNEWLKNSFAFICCIHYTRYTLVNLHRLNIHKYTRIWVLIWVSEKWLEKHNFRLFVIFITKSSIKFKTLNKRWNKIK